MEFNATYLTCAILLVGVFFFVKYMIAEEVDDRKVLNRNYHETVLNNPQCNDYLQQVVAIPTWRLACMGSMVVVFTVIVFVFLIEGTPSRSMIASLLALFLLVSAVIYVLLGFVKWHYVCDEQCISKPIFISQMDSAACTSNMQQARAREELFRTIITHNSPSIGAGTELFQRITDFFNAPTLFAGTTSIERRRVPSALCNQNGVLPLVELYTSPQNARIWSFIER